MNILRMRTLLAPALLLTALSGCEGVFGGDGDQAQRDELSAARNRWEAANINSYSYVIDLFCTCGTAAQLRPVRVTVVNNAVVSRIYENNDPALRTPAPEAVFGPYDTVEELFETIENSIGNDADILNVAYDPQEGVPVLLQYDPDSGNAEDNLVFEISGFAETNP